MNNISVENLGNIRKYFIPGKCIFRKMLKNDIIQLPFKRGQRGVYREYVEIKKSRK